MKKKEKTKTRLQNKTSEDKTCVIDTQSDAEFEKLMKAAEIPDYLSKKNPPDLSDESAKFLDQVKKEVAKNMPVSPKRKPVAYTDHDISYIDDDGSNTENAMPDLDRLEKGEQHNVQYNILADENEQKMYAAKMQNAMSEFDNDDILPPDSNGMFCSLKEDPIGNDLIPESHATDQAKVKFNRLPPQVQDKKNAVPEEKTEEAKAAEEKANEAKQALLNRQKKKKKKEKAETYIMPKTSSQDLTPDALAALIEGTTEKITEKPTTTKKEKRRKSREKKEDVKEGEEVKKKKNNDKKEKSPDTDKKKKMDVAVAENNNSPVEDKPAPVLNKRTTSGNANSWDNDNDEEYVSADEGTGPNSRLTTPPTEFAAATSDVMLDPANYREFRDDDEDVASITQQLKKEEEFITVGGKNKKKVEKRTGSAGDASRVSPQHTSNQVAHSSQQQPRRSVTSSSGEERRYSLQNETSGSNKQRRPQSTVLGDFMDNAKKDTHKSLKHKKKGNLSTEESFVDALDTTLTVNTDTSTSSQPAQPSAPSPDRSFSYADAAKRSSDASGESSPSGPSPSPAAASSAKNISPKASESPRAELQVNPNVQLLPKAYATAAASASAQGVTFHYDESEHKASAPHSQTTTEADSATSSADGAFVLNLGGRNVTFAKGHASVNAGQDNKDPRYVALEKFMKDGWDKFMSGTPPKLFVPRTPKN